MTPFSLKKLLYEELDPLMIKLNNCTGHNDLLETIMSNEANMTRAHRIQSVILHWMFFRYDTKTETSPHKINILQELILTKLHAHVPAMDLNELSCCFLYLRKMGVPNVNIVLQDLLLHALHLVDTATQSPPTLPVLSRLAIGINTERDFHTPTVCRNFVPHIESHIKTCSSDEEARLLGVCLITLQPLIDTEILDNFKARVHELLAAKKITADTPKCILKLLHLLNMPAWSQQNTRLLRELLLVLQPCLPLLSDNDIKVVCRIYQYHLEPAALNDSLMQASKKLLLENAQPDSLACFIPFAEPQKREPMIALFKQLITAPDSWMLPNASGHFFTILRGLKISDSKLCDIYCEGVMRELDSCEEEETQLRFLRHCHRYMNFNNNLGGTYRHMELERKLSQMAMRTIVGDLAGRIPTKFARLAAFVFAYGHTPHHWKKFPNVLLSKIISMAPQFSIADCFTISRGLQIATELRFRYHTPSLIGMQLTTIDSILTTCAERHLNRDNFTVNDLNGIVRLLSNRKSLKNTVVYNEALNRYEELAKSELNSRKIRDLTYNFTTANFLAPKMLDAMFDYIEKHQEHVSGDTVEKVLTCSYNVGYSPQSLEVLDYAAVILLRDFNYMSGLSILQACLSLCFYKRIPEDLINRVFCVKFIQRIEEEIQLCYSRATYPERVLNLVMQLNRTVCLDFPEANVPWFQQNYLEAHLNKKPFVQSSFSENVKQLLAALLKDETYFRCNHTTPYGYHIDFVLHFDRNRQPIVEPAETAMLDRITKVAILLLKLDSFCENDLKALRGPESLKMKHLEMMGYKVLHISEQDWYSKYLNAPGAKINYLKSLLQIK